MEEGLVKTTDQLSVDIGPKLITNIGECLEKDAARKDEVTSCNWRSS